MSMISLFEYNTGMCESVCAFILRKRKTTSILGEQAGSVETSLQWWPGECLA